MRTLSFQSLPLSETTEEFRRSVCENVNTNLEQLEKDVQSLKDWAKSQPHLPQYSSETMLTSYILACKNRLERAKEKIGNYYKARADMPDLFADRDPTNEKMQNCGKIFQLYQLPKMTPDGCRISMCSYTTRDAKHFSTKAFSKIALMGEDIKMNKEAFLKGDYYVFDGQHLTMGHVLKITPKFVSQLLYCAQDVLPIIIKGIVFFNAPAYLELVLNIMRPFMKNKLFQRINVHSEGPEVLEKYFPRALLPKDYGGEEESSAKLNEAWMHCLIDNREWFLNEGQVKSNLNKKKVEDETGDVSDVQGPFGSLCID